MKFGWFQVGTCNTHNIRSSCGQYSVIIVNSHYRPIGRLPSCFGHSLHRTSERRYMTNVGIGYLIPFIIVMITLTAEMNLAHCSPWRPRFGEEICFFSGTINDINCNRLIWNNFIYFYVKGKKSQWMWFYGPITVMILLNIIVCFKISNTKQKLRITDQNKHTEDMDK